MNIIVDAFGGDNAPLEILKGCAQAIEEYGVTITVTGDEEVIKKVCSENAISMNGMKIVNAPDVIPVECEPTEILKSHADCSMAVGMKLLAQGEGDAFVTAGSTGAAVVGASLIVKRLKGVKRPAIAPIIPTTTGCYILVDAGANVDCRPEMLTQFAIMGSAYMNRVKGIDSPRVGLVNIGAEETKGGQLQVDAHNMLKKAPVNFIGNVEPRYLPTGACDVAVTDGFTGNTVLKLTEGLAKSLSGQIKGIFYKSLINKIAGLIIKKDMDAFKKTMDYKEHGGAALLGAAHPVIKAHGSSDARAFKNAIRQAKEFVEGDVNAQILKALEEMKTKASAKDEVNA